MDSDFTLKTGKSIRSILNRAKGKYWIKDSVISSEYISIDWNFDIYNKIWLGYNDMSRLEKIMIDSDYDKKELTSKSKMQIISENIATYNTTILDDISKTISNKAFDIEAHLNNTDIWNKKLSYEYNGNIASIDDNLNLFNDYFDKKLKKEFISLVNGQYKYISSVFKYIQNLILFIKSKNKGNTELGKIWGNYQEAYTKEVFEVINSMEIFQDTLFNVYLSQNNFSKYFTLFNNLVLVFQIVVSLINLIIGLLLYLEIKHTLIKIGGYISWFLSCFNAFSSTFIIFFLFLIGFLFVLTSNIIIDLTFRTNQYKYRLCFNEFDDVNIFAVTNSPERVKVYDNLKDTVDIFRSFYSLMGSLNYLKNIDKFENFKVKEIEIIEEESFFLLLNPKNILINKSKYSQNENNREYIPGDLNSLLYHFGSYEQILNEINSYIDFNYIDSKQIQNNCLMFQHLQIMFDVKDCKYKYLKFSEYKNVYLNLFTENSEINTDVSSNFNNYIVVNDVSMLNIDEVKKIYPEACFTFDDLTEDNIKDILLFENCYSNGKDNTSELKKRAEEIYKDLYKLTHIYLKYVKDILDDGIHTLFVKTKNENDYILNHSLEYDNELTNLISLLDESFHSDTLKRIFQEKINPIHDIKEYINLNNTAEQIVEYRPKSAVSNEVKNTDQSISYPTDPKLNRLNIVEFCSCSYYRNIMFNIKNVLDTIIINTLYQLIIDYIFFFFFTSVTAVTCALAININYYESKDQDELKFGNKENGNSIIDAIKTKID